MARMKFINTEVDNLTMDETLKEIERLIHAKKNAYVIPTNVDCLVKLEKSEKLAVVYKNADLILADGKPLIWISKIYKRPIREKISGADLFPLVCKMAAEKGYTMFFLGAAEGVAEKAAENLTKRFPGLRVVGSYSPPFGFENDPEEVRKSVERVRDAHPDILMVGLGCPKQEFFIYDHRDEMKVPVSIAVGAGLDFEAGRVKRAPKWMSDHGFEWLFRITQDSKRLFRRYFIDDTKILGMAVRYRNNK